MNNSQLKSACLCAGALAAMLALAGLPAQAGPTITVTARRTQEPPPGIPAEKRKSLHKLGPEDVFPNAREGEERRKNDQRSRRNRRTDAARPAAKPAATAVAILVAPATPSPIAVLEPSPTPASTAEPPAAAVASSPPTDLLPRSNRLLPILVIIAVLVALALLIVVARLTKLLRSQTY